MSTGCQFAALHVRRSAIARFLLLVFTFVRLANSQSESRPPAQHSEYQVKAAFLLNFTKFVDWPEDQFPDADTPLTICIAGEDPFGSALDEVVAGEVVNGRKVVIERLKEQLADRCPVLFVNKIGKEATKIVSAAGPGVLTIGEGKNFVDDGGIIGFVVENRRVRFDINQKAAQRAGLRISSRLLSVARSVEK